MGFMEYVKSIEWEHESYPDYEDFIALPLFALFFPFVRFFLDRFVFQKVAQHLIFGKEHQTLDVQSDERRKKIRKFKESAWKCIYFLSSEILVLCVTYDEPWLGNTKYFWVGPGSQAWPDQKMKLKLKAVYMYAAGFYTYSIFALIFWETRRSDFGVSMSHHVATVILIVLSYILSYEVLLILDKEKHPVDGSNLLLCVQYSPLLLTFSSWILILRAKMNMKIDQTMKYNRGFICWRCSFPEMERDEKKQFLPIKGLLKLKAVYMYAAGFYTYSIFALIFWETRRSDFGVSMSHHVATVILIVLSYILRFGRVGSVVLAIHDASDVFLEVGKMSKYSGAEGVASFAFILFVLSWILLRLIYYPFWVLWSTSYEVLLILDKEKHPVDGPIYYYVFNTLLYCLLFLHVYWWVLIYQMLAKQIQARGHLSDDVRSDSEGEDEHED
ncbi:LAG1 longevity assurance [Populus alba x Populus x berolinensis]|uniref:LAG1 longevity assurance n=1 Tax=Populus alba x Populus x berolinensis TaxID=444605 RepID=A0AAD6QD99_9ROSI|nr:LAG1 longevity assurance [Populus alba x Populus x berolinensis]